MKPRRSAESVGAVLGFRSGLEEVVARDLKGLGVPFDYEAYKLTYVKKPATYLTDFILPNGIVIETKGHFVSEDRTKHRQIKAQHPGLDLRFVFSNPRTKIGKLSDTTYGIWCERFGFQFAERSIPIAWLLEPAEPNRVAAAVKAFDWVPPEWDPEDFRRRLADRPSNVIPIAKRKRTK